MHGQAKDALRHVCDVQPKDYASWVELGQLLEASEPEKALQAYERGAKLLENLKSKGEGDVPAELYNNIGALRHLLSALLVIVVVVATDGMSSEAADGTRQRRRGGAGAPL